MAVTSRTGEAESRSGRWERRLLQELEGHDGKAKDISVGKKGVKLGDSHSVEGAGWGGGRDFGSGEFKIGRSSVWNFLPTLPGRFVGICLPTLSSNGWGHSTWQDFPNSASLFGLKVVNSQHNGHTHDRNSSTHPKLNKGGGDGGGGEKPMVWRFSQPSYK